MVSDLYLEVLGAYNLRPREIRKVRKNHNVLLWFLKFSRKFLKRIFKDSLFLPLNPMKTVNHLPRNFFLATGLDSICRD